MQSALREMHPRHSEYTHRRLIAKAHPTAPAAGFTLLELMVAMVVMAIAVSMVTLSLSANSARALDGTAESLSSALEAVRWQAISTGRLIAWEAPQADSPGRAVPAWYEQAPDGHWEPRADFFRTPSLDGIAVTVVQPRAANSGGVPGRLTLGPEPVGLPACVLLSRERSTVAVVSDGVSPFLVRRGERCGPGAS
jgi:type II secretion system protein H